MQMTFSGTNCNLSAWVSTDVGYVTDGTIYIGGEPTATFHNDDITKKRIDFGVTWDSTHFAHGSVVQLLVVGRNSLGQEGRSNRIFQDKIYNRYSAYARSDFEALLPTATDIQSSLQEMNYGATYSFPLGWSDGIALDSVKVDTLQYYATHARVKFGVPLMDDDWPYQGYITSPEVQTARGQRAASLPPINFVFLNGCGTAENVGSPTWPTAFGIVGSTDRAIIGWLGSCLTFGAQQSAIEFWANVSLGDKVNEALEKANDIYDDLDPRPNIDLIVAGGDPYTKLRGVYGGYWLLWYR
ncbi:MAG: hypothetical protein IT210_00955 [Armatimonadetes bacterium]|nr:hypothetical protein [Armatimonadota bacterium]